MLGRVLAMPPCFLFGPTTAEFADSVLGELRRDGTCLAFGPGGVDLTVGPEREFGKLGHLRSLNPCVL